MAEEPVSSSHGVEVKARRRILYVQRSSGGGSVINVLLLVRNLDRDRFAPTVLFYESSPYAEAFEKAGADVRVLDASVSVRSLRTLLPGAGSPDRHPSGVRRLARQANRFAQREWPLARRIARVIRETGAEIVQGSVSPSADRSAMVAARLCGVPRVCYVQYLGDHSRLIDSPLSRFVGGYLCISQWVQKRLLAELGIPEGKTRVVYAPFEFPTPADAGSRRRVREALGIREDQVLIANVGRLVPWKGQDVFLRAFAGVVREHPEARGVIVGGANASEASRGHAARLESLRRELGLAERVVFTGHRDDVDRIVAASDALVHSSSEPEPLGRVVMEGVALHVPVIATGAGGVPEMIRDGETGTLVPPGDSAAMKRALADFLQDRPRALAMAARAREVARTRFSTERFVRAMEETYDRLLGSPPPSTQLASRCRENDTAITAGREL